MAKRKGKTGGAEELSAPLTSEVVNRDIVVVRPDLKDRRPITHYGKDKQGNFIALTERQKNDPKYQYQGSVRLGDANPFLDKLIKPKIVTPEDREEVWGKTKSHYFYNKKDGTIFTHNYNYSSPNAYYIGEMTGQEYRDKYPNGRVDV